MFANRLKSYAMSNSKFGKLDEYGMIVYAPNAVRTERGIVVSPDADTYAAAGWLPVVDEPPIDPAPDGYHYEPRGWEIWDDDRSPVPRCVRRVYEAVQDPPAPPRRWTRLALKTALAQAEMLDAAKAYLSGVEIATGYTALEALTDADYIEEGFGGAEKWNAILDGAASALGKTRALIDAFLDAVPTEGGV